MTHPSRYHVTESRMAEELAWIEAAKSDPAAFGKLYIRYHEPIFRFIYQRLDDKDQAFDLTSQVFLKAMLNLYRFRFRGLPFASWLYRIAGNELNDLFKKNSRARTVNAESAGLFEMMEEMDEEEELFEARKKQVLDAVASLPETELRLIEMRFFEKRAFREIAEILDMTESNAKVRLYRTLGKLRKMISTTVITK